MHKVAIGSGGVFNGMSYIESKHVRSGQDFILDRLPLAQGLQYITLFWSMPKGMNPGFACRAPGGESGGGAIV